MKKVLILLLFLSFCSDSQSNDLNSISEESTTTSESIVTTTTNSVDDNKQESFLVENLEDAQNAVVRIVTQGEYVFPGDNYEIVSEMIPGSGSGFLISQDGYIVTNSHVVSGASTIEIYFNDEKDSIPAQLIAKSECLDLAVLKIRGNKYNYFKFNTDETKVGTEIRAAGYPLGDAEFTLTDGIVSKSSTDGAQTWASVQESFEHTATINPGSSGGPIFDNQFRVIGVSYAGNSANQYFAIKSSLVNTETNILIDTEESFGVGMNFQLIEGLGIYIYSTDSGQSFDKLGIKGGDIITSFAGFDLTTESDMKNFCNSLTAKGSSGSIKVEGYRFSNDSYFSGATNSDTPLEFDELVEASPTTTANTTTTTLVKSKAYSTETVNAWYKVVSQNDFYADWGRWNKSNVNVGIIGEPSVLQIDTMKYMIGDLNRIVSRINWEWTYVTLDNINDFDIYLIFTDNSEWNEWSEVWDTTVKTTFDDGTKKYYEKIRRFSDLESADWGLGVGFIDPNNSSYDECQIYSIRGIMLALVGLGDLYTDEYGQNVMLGTKCTHVLTPLDESMITLHYDLRLPNTSNIADVKKVAQNLTK